jgi:hypothetical protein
MPVAPSQGQPGDVVVDEVKLRIAADAIKQQVDLLAHWSRFYHDAEIKVNSASIAISAIAAVGDKLVPSAAMVSVLGKPFNMIGFFIAIVSAAAFLSTLGYWRYYEMCDLLGKTYRKRILPDDIRNAVNIEYERKFKEAYPRFSRFGGLWDDAHHLVWLICQFILVCLGLYLMFNAQPIARP